MHCRGNRRLASTARVQNPILNGQGGGQGRHHLEHRGQLRGAVAQGTSARQWARDDHCRATAPYWERASIDGSQAAARPIKVESPDRAPSLRSTDSKSNPSNRRRERRSNGITCAGRREGYVIGSRRDAVMCFASISDLVSRARRSPHGPTQRCAWLVVDVKAAG